MPTTIQPSLGAGVLLTEQGVGQAPGYSAIDFRRLAALGLQEGVMGANDFKVTQRGAGANMSVDIAAGAGAQAVVQGDSIAGQGMYVVAPHGTATVNEAIAAANPTNPRLDQVILEVLDNQHDASGSNFARLRVLTGTPTAGATLDNRAGFSAFPGNCIRLADVLVPPASSSVVAANIRDRRPWARGAHTVAQVSGSLVITTSQTTLAAYTTRLECSGTPLCLTLTGQAQSSSASDRLFIGPTIDGSFVRAGANQVTPPQTGQPQEFSITWGLTPSAGSHVFSVVGAGVTSNIFVEGPSALRIEELVRQLASN